jgi:8-oxo-dGTP diphosphatase
MPHTYEYPRPALAVDCAVLGFDEGDLKVLLIKRGLEPFKGKWALPGGFVRLDESLDVAARRELAEETGLTHVFLEQLYTFGEVKRDPRGRTVSVAYFALVKLGEQQVQAATDAQAAQWFSAEQAPALAFDHGRILETALVRLRNKVRYVPIGFELLPRKFTLTQLQHLYEAILGRALDKRNFRKKALALGVLEATKEQEQDVAHRAARLYRFDEETYAKLVKKGFNFEL